MTIPTTKPVSIPLRAGPFIVSFTMSASLLFFSFSGARGRARLDGLKARQQAEALSACRSIRPQLAFIPRHSLRTASSSHRWTSEGTRTWSGVI